jgi:hypothetical protein
MSLESPINFSINSNYFDLKGIKGLTHGKANMHLKKGHYVCFRIVMSKFAH